MFGKLTHRFKDENPQATHFKQLCDNVEDLRAEKLKPEQLDILLAGIKERHKVLVDLVTVATKTLHLALDDGDLHEVDMQQDLIREHKREFLELESSRKRLEDARQRQHIREGISNNKYIGERGNSILSVTVLVLIVVVLSLLSFELLMVPEIVETLEAPDWVWWIFWIDLGACTVFQFEFFLRRYYAEDKSWFWRKNWVDFVSSIPVPPIGVTGHHYWGRLVRLIRILRLWRAMRIGLFLWRGMERLQRVTNVRLMRRSLMLAAAFILGGATIAFLTEQPAVREPAGFAYSLWWSFNAVATGDFADLHAPAGAPLQVVTALLILSGMVVVSVFIATLTAVYQGEEMEPARKKQKEMHELLHELRDVVNVMAEAKGDNNEDRQ